MPSERYPQSTSRPRISRRRRTPKISRRLRQAMMWTPHALPLLAQDLVDLGERRVVGDDADRHAVVRDGSGHGLVVAHVADGQDEAAPGRLAPDAPDLVDIEAGDQREQLVGRARRQAHELDEVAPVAEVGPHGLRADAWVVRWQAEHVPEVAVRPPALGRPRQVRELRQPADDLRRRARWDGRQHPRCRAIAHDRDALDDARGGSPASMRRLEAATVGACRLGRGVGGPGLGTLARRHRPALVATRDRAAGQLAQLACDGLLVADQRLRILAADERLDALASDVVGDLLRRALHEVRGRRHERALEPAVEAQLEQRMASVMTPALLGLSQTSSLISALSGTSP